jgi:hypothetical protein
MTFRCVTAPTVSDPRTRKKTGTRSTFYPYLRYCARVPTRRGERPFRNMETGRPPGRAFARGSGARPKAPSRVFPARRAINAKALLIPGNLSRGIGPARCARCGGDGGQNQHPHVAWSVVHRKLLSRQSFGIIRRSETAGGRGEQAGRGCRSTPGSISAGDEVLGDVAGVLPDPSDMLRGRRVLEGQPEKVQARRGVHHAPVVDWVATIVEDGQFDPAEVSRRKPVAHTTAATSSTRPSASRGLPAAKPSTPSTSSTPVATMSLGLRRTSGAPRCRCASLIFRPSLVSVVSTRSASHKEKRGGGGPEGRLRRGGLLREVLQARPRRDPTWLAPRRSPVSRAPRDALTIVRVRAKL